MSRRFWRLAARYALLLAAGICFVVPRELGAQGLTGALNGIVVDQQGGVVAGARVELRSDALIGGPITQTTDAWGRWRFPTLSPGSYALDVAVKGFSSSHEASIVIGAGGTIERMVRLTIANVASSVVVEGSGSHLDARNAGLSSRFGPEDLAAIPTRRASMFDFVRASPGVSPTSPSSGTATTVSVFGSGTNENQFLIDGLDSTCPCNGLARSEPGIDFIQEIQIQSIGASAEHGNVQGGVINVITRQGSDRFRYDAAYYGQPSSLTSQPVRVPYDSVAHESAYSRTRYRDFTTSLGGPIMRERVWFYAGYQYLRDYDSQPGTDPAYPRTYEQNKLSLKSTWAPAAGWQVMQSLHHERWVSPEQPTLTKPFDATQRRHASVPAITFVDLTHVVSPTTLWEVRVGRFVHARVDDPSSGNATTPSHLDKVTGVTTGGPAQLGRLTLIRTTAKATVTQYHPRLFRADHEWKFGGQFERGESKGYTLIPTGVRYVDRSGQPFQAISSDPSLTGGLFITAAAFASDTISAGERTTISAGVRFDLSRAISQDLHAVDAHGQETDAIVPGLGALYTWSLLSPRLGVVVKLTGDARTILRGSYGRFYQGALTGEFSAFHPGVTPVTTSTFNMATASYLPTRVVDSKTTLQLDSGMRAPHTDEYSIGVDREITRRFSAAIAYVHKRGADFIGWTEVGGVYRLDQQTLPDGRVLPVFLLVNSIADQRFRLTNPDGYSMTYHGLVVAGEKRRSNGWQLSGSYTFSRVDGLQASSGATASSAQSSTVALPTVPIGRDPNDLTNARGRLPNDRPHVFRVMAIVDVPRTGLVVAANLQHFTGKPWAATTQASLPQGDQRILIEAPGSRRLSSQTLLDVRLSRAFRARGLGRVELLLDVLNALNDTAEEDVATDNFFSPTFGRPTVFMDPRRAMLGVRLNLGR